MPEREFFDLQVNGYGGVNFTDDELTGPGLHRACERLRADGVKNILATIVTEHVDTMLRRLSTESLTRENGGEGPIRPGSASTSEASASSRMCDYLPPSRCGDLCCRMPI